MKEVAPSYGSQVAGRIGQTLASFPEAADTTSRSVTKATDKLYKHVEDACEQVDNLLMIPGCQMASASAVGDCVDWAARCRACQLLLAADARLSMDCDEFDNGLVDLTCHSCAANGRNPLSTKVRSRAEARSPKTSSAI